VNITSPFQAYDLIHTSALSMGQKALAKVLVHHATWKATGAVWSDCWPGKARMAKSIGCSIRTLERILSSLHKAGILSSTKMDTTRWSRRLIFDKMPVENPVDKSSSDTDSLSQTPRQDVGLPTDNLSVLPIQVPNQNQTMDPPTPKGGGSQPCVLSGLHWKDRALLKKAGLSSLDQLSALTDEHWKDLRYGHNGLPAFGGPRVRRIQEALHATHYETPTTTLKSQPVLVELPAGAPEWAAILLSHPSYEGTDGEALSELADMCGGWEKFREMNEDLL